MPMNRNNRYILCILSIRTNPGKENGSTIGFARISQIIDALFKCHRSYIQYIINGAYTRHYNYIQDILFLDAAAHFASIASSSLKCAILLSHVSGFGFPVGVLGAKQETGNAKGGSKETVSLLIMERAFSP
jgi:hypothetical protein